MTKKSKNQPLLIHKIQNKIVFTALITQIFVSSLMGILLYNNSKNILIESTKKQTISILEPLKLITQERLKSIDGLEDKKNYLNIVLNLQGQTMFPELKTKMPNLKEIYIYTDRKDIHTLDKQPLWIFPKLQKILSHKDSSVIFTTNSLFINVPIHVDDAPLGGIILEYSKDTINSEKQKALITSIAIALFAFLISLTLIKIFTKSITNPLQNIITDLEEVANSGDLTESKYTYSKLKDSEFEPLISSYLKMKETIAEQINELNIEISKRKTAENEATLNKNYLAELIDEKSDAIKGINIMLKEEKTRRTEIEKKTKTIDCILNSLLETKQCAGVLVINNKGEVIKTNKHLCHVWDLPEEVIINDNEEQLINYFSYQIINNKKFLTNYKKCEEESLELGSFELKDGRKVFITFYPLIQDSKTIGKILIFQFS